MRQRLLPLLAAAACVAWGCGSTTSGPEASPSPLGSPSAIPTPGFTRAFAYAAFGDGPGGIAAYRVDLDTGALLPIMTAPLRVPRGLAADPGHRYLYTVDNDDDFPAR